MPGGGSKPGERRGGRKKGTPNKFPRAKTSRAKPEPEAKSTVAKPLGKRAQKLAADLAATYTSSIVSPVVDGVAAGAEAAALGTGPGGSGFAPPGPPESVPHETLPQPAALDRGDAPLVVLERLLVWSVREFERLNRLPNGIERIIEDRTGRVLARRDAVDYAKLAVSFAEKALPYTAPRLATVDPNNRGAATSVVVKIVRQGDDEEITVGVQAA